MKATEKKTIKSFYLFAIASYMLAQAALLLFSSAFHFAAVPSVLDYGPLRLSHFFMSWHFTAEATLGHMLFLWGFGTVLFALILWLFQKLCGENPLPADVAVSPRQEPASAAMAQNPGSVPEVAIPEAENTAAPEIPDAADVMPEAPGTATSAPEACGKPESATAPRMTLYPPHSDVGSGLGIISVICGCIGFIPGLGLAFAIAGIITGALGNMRASAAGNSAGRTLSIIGIVLSAISLFLMISTVLFLGSLFRALFGTMV